MRFAHTNIAARDWKKLVDFYTRVFQCTVKLPERDLNGDWLDNATGLSNARLKGVHLLLPGHGDNPPTLEIFTYEEMQEHNPIMANYIGLTHIAFEVEDVDTTYELAMQHGGGELGKITQRVIEGVGILKFVYMRDPEGNIIEIQSWASQEV
jgi:catechol 2,3-dioxygenase-like lactoylglutathione lyase family enzyme